MGFTERDMAQAGPLFRALYDARRAMCADHDPGFITIGSFMGGSITVDVDDPFYSTAKSFLHLAAEQRAIKIEAKLRYLGAEVPE